MQQASANEWTTGAQQQPSATDWHTSAQQQPSASDWHNQPQQWNAQGQPGGNPGGQGQNWIMGGQIPQGQYGQAQQYQSMPARPRTGIANVFDFSFRRLALPEAGGAIFLIVVIATTLGWLVTTIYSITVTGGQYGSDAGYVTQLILGSLVKTVLIILAARVFLEGMTALVVSSQRDRGRNNS